MLKMSRRDFVKVTGTGLALATLPGFIRSGFAGDQRQGFFTANDIYNSRFN